MEYSTHSFSILPEGSRTDWPWIMESTQQAEKMPDGSPWPKISIVTPSYNQGQFIEETIRSVLLQEYSNLEYIIIDGGSKDRSVEVIKKCNHLLHYWVSEPDRGQAHAINKGFFQATGSLLGWLNSDDLLAPGSLKVLGEAHIKYPDKILVGHVENLIYLRGRWRSKEIIEQKGLTFRNFVQYWNRRNAVWHQPGVFFPSFMLKKAGLLDESLRYSFDTDLMCRLLQDYDVHYIDEILAKFRLHPNSKTVSEGYLFLSEGDTVSRRYWKQFEDLDLTNYDRFLSRQYFIHGLARLKFGKRNGFQLVGKAFRTQPQGIIDACLLLVKLRIKRAVALVSRKIF